MSTIVSTELEKIHCHSTDDEISAVKMQLLSQVSPQTQAIAEIFQENAVLKRENEIHLKTLKGVVLLTVRDVVKRLLEELKTNPAYQEKVKKDLAGLGKVNFDEFIGMLEAEVQQGHVNLDSCGPEWQDWTVVNPKDGKKDIKDLIQEHIVKTYNIHDPARDVSASNLRRLFGWVGTGVVYTGKGVYLTLWVAYRCLQIGTVIAPLLPIALFLLRSYGLSLLL